MKTFLNDSGFILKISPAFSAFILVYYISEKQVKAYQ